MSDPVQGESIARPTREELAALAEFAGLPLEHVVLPADPEGVARAVADLAAHPWLGFDTESKPTFARGENSGGPHLVQFSTLTTAYLFQLQHEACREAVAKLLADGSILKVGFGLDTDLTQVEARLGVKPLAVLDLDRLFHRMGHGRSFGVKNAVAVVFGRHFHKSRRMTTSNWSEPRLSDRQRLYAANDAYAAACVYQALGTPAPPPVEPPVPKPEPRRRPRRRRRGSRSREPQE